jgi:cobalt-zinc-cadmium efflux system outer membrane protein
MTNRNCTIFSALALALAIAASARAVPLTYDEALTLSDQSAPSLEAKALDLRAAQASAVAAGRLPDPKLRFGLDNFPISGPPAGQFGPDSMTMATVGVMQDLPNGAKRRAARERADADIRSAQASQVVEARNVRISAALAWIDLYFATRRLTALDEIAAALVSLRKTAPSQLASGAVRPAQTVEPDQLLAAVGDRRADLVAAQAKARAELARWTGDPDPIVAGAPPDMAVDTTALHAGLDGHPSLLAYDALGRQADADVAAARAEKRPDWSWELAYQHRDPMWGDMVSLEGKMSLPLFGKTRQDPLIVARTETASRVRIEREATRRALVAQLDADLADHLMHHDRLMRAQSTLVPLAKRRADLERSSYAAGNASLSDVLQAFVSLAEARVDTLDRQADVVRDAVRINLTYETSNP